MTESDSLALMETMSRFSSYCGRKLPILALCMAIQMLVPILFHEDGLLSVRLVPCLVLSMEQVADKVEAFRGALANQDFR
jgi:hypothetical protein